MTARFSCAGRNAARSLRRGPLRMARRARRPRRREITTPAIASARADLVAVLRRSNGRRERARRRGPRVFIAAHGAPTSTSWRDAEILVRGPERGAHGRAAARCEWRPPAAANAITTLAIAAALRTSPLSVHDGAWAARFPRGAWRSR